MASQEISASTAQLVFASRVKAEMGSKNLQALAEASKSVSSATGGVVAAAKHCAELVEESSQFQMRTIHLTTLSIQFNSIRFSFVIFVVLRCADVLDFGNLTLHQAKRFEMESQVKVLELESSLEKERLRLAALRRQHYTMAGETDA